MAVIMVVSWQSNNMLLVQNGQVVTTVAGHMTYLHRIHRRYVWGKVYKHWAMAGNNRQEDPAPGGRPRI